MSDSKESRKGRGLSPALYRTIVERCADAIVVTDGDQTIRFANDSALAMFGWDADALIGQRLDVLLPARFHDIHRALVRHFGEASETARFMREREGPLLGLRSDGEEFPVDVSIVKSAIGRQHYFVAIVRDIADAKQQEEALRRMVFAAEAASVAKSTFVANMSHEIRTPLNAVLGMAEVLADTALSAPQRDYLDSIREAGEQLLSVLNDVLELSAIDAGAAEPDIGDVDVAVLIGRLRTLWQPRAAAKGLDLAARCDTDMPRIVRTDGDRLRQILAILISNAIKFTDSGGIDILAEAACGADGPPALRIVVRDTGIGMTADQVQAAFDRFVQGDGSMSRRHGGTGLGLAIAKGLVELLGGEIAVDSVPGGGSAFLITLPVGEAASIGEAASA